MHFQQRDFWSAVPFRDGDGLGNAFESLRTPDLIENAAAAKSLLCSGGTC